MKPPGSVKDIQVLNERLVALHCFLAIAAEQTLPFMVALKESLKKNEFQWSKDASLDFEDLKKLFVYTSNLNVTSSRGRTNHVSNSFARDG
jgi:hypothetical protein